MNKKQKSHYISVIKFITLPLIVLMLAAAGSGELYAADASTTVFAVRNPGVNNCRAEISAQYAAVITRTIRNEKGFAIGDKKNPPLYTVSGSITRIAGKSDREVTKYVTEENESDRFTILIRVTDTTTGKTDSSYSDSVGGYKGLNRSAENIARKIIERYRKTSVDTEASDNRSSNSVLFSYRSAELYPFALKGFGGYTDFSNTGFGVGAALSFNTGPMILRPSFDGGYCSAADAAIDRTLVFKGVLNLGYPVVENDSVIIMPFAGGGVIHHRVSGEIDGVKTNKSYTHPMVSGGVSFDFIFSGRYALFFRPQYGVFFEKSATDHFAEIGIGFRLNH